MLAGESGTAREPLLFAALLCREQGRIAEALEDAHLTGHLEQDGDRLIDHLRALTRLAAEKGPPQLSEEAQKRASDEPETARSRLLLLWQDGTSGREDYLSRALLRPYAELLREQNILPDRLHRRGHCPFCGGAAWISARKALSDGDGGLRMLGCSLCGCEWNFNRICCPSCFEEEPKNLPVFQSDLYPTVRIEACETCRRYVKSIDLTLDARPIPEIDDLLSLSMDLWAMEEGLTRIEPGLAGL